MRRGWYGMPWELVRRGRTRGVRMNGHLCLAEEWLEQGGKESAEPGKDELGYYY